MNTVLVPRIPALVDEVSVRLIAGVVLAVGIVALVTQQWWLYALLAIDFTIRAVAGPRHSPLAQLVNRWIRPLVRIAPRLTAFTPKRFAAGIGAVMTAALTVLWLVRFAAPAPGLGVAMLVIAAVMVLFPALEAVLGLCVGCKIFGLLGRVGLISEDVCVDCVRPSARAERVKIRV
ncbi:protein of unknown function [Raineyella antarctica]|uniref:DUF4395 domain-containing protein n=1 Tax=Raineyella antarctica TaxID=1577474 RepID=A0A1G6HF65_9ACTN|nr:DUF4395 domain-containing protein [Raineyella antarctica]SDB92861.1 protein of unknown function [Raineyella antarctica]